MKHYMVYPKLSARKYTAKNIYVFIYKKSQYSLLKIMILKWFSHYRGEKTHEYKTHRWKYIPCWIFGTFSFIFVPFLFCDPSFFPLPSFFRSFRVFLSVKALVVVLVVVVDVNIPIGARVEPGFLPTVTVSRRERKGDAAADMILVVFLHEESTSFSVESDLLIWDNDI